MNVLSYEVYVALKCFSSHLLHTSELNSSPSLHFVFFTLKIKSWPHITVGFLWYELNQQSRDIFKVTPYFDGTALSLLYKMSIEFMPSHGKHRCSTTSYIVLRRAHTFSSLAGPHAGAIPFCRSKGLSGSIVPSCHNTHFQLPHIVIKPRLKRTVTTLRRTNHHIAQTTMTPPPSRYRYPFILRKVPCFWRVVSNSFEQLALPRFWVTYIKPGSILILRIFPSGVAKSSCSGRRCALICSF